MKPSQEKTASPVDQAMLVHKESRVTRESRALKANKDFGDLLVKMAMMDNRDDLGTSANKESRDRQGIPAHRASKESKDRKVSVDLPAKMVRMAGPDDLETLAHRESRENLDRQA